MELFDPEFILDDPSLSEPFAAALLPSEEGGSGAARPEQVAPGTPSCSRCTGLPGRGWWRIRRTGSIVPTQPFSTPRGTIRVSTVEATAVDLIGYPHHAGGLEHAATVIAELAERIDPARLVAAARTAPMPWAQRLGYLLDEAGEADKAELLKRHVREEARDITPLIPAMSREGAMRDAGWKLDVNADVEIEP